MAVAASSDVGSLNLRWNSTQEEVMCVLISRESNILTGHESRLLIWSVDISLRKTCLKETVELPVKGIVSCICQFLHDAILAVAIANTVLMYRYSIVEDNVTSLSLIQQFCFHQDEINQLDVHPKKLLVCSCDDSGEIVVVDVDNGKLLQRLSNFHESIVSTVRFSKKKPWELFSGGLDCSVGRWDFGRGSLLASKSTQNESSTKVLLINPPMAHSLDLFCNHPSMVCGLGDGRLVAYSLKHPKTMDTICEIHAHAASVACIRCFESTSTSGDSPTLYVASVGNDSVACVHKLAHQKEQSEAAFMLVGKLSPIPKVNWIDINLCSNTTLLYLYTADITGTISMYSFKLL